MVSKQLKFKSHNMFADQKEIEYVLCKAHFWPKKGSTCGDILEYKNITALNTHNNFRILV